jgi:hypothetical protein
MQTKITINQNPFRNDFTIIVLKNVVLYEIYSIKSRVTILMFIDCTFVLYFHYLAIYNIVGPLS